MSQRKTWPLVTSIILAVLSVAFWSLLLLVPDVNSDPSMITGCIIYIVYSLIYWLPTFIHSSPKVFLINCANILCCFVWIAALIVSIMDKKNPNGTSMPAWNQNPTWDTNGNANAQNYWGNDQNNQWGNQNAAQGQQPAQPTAQPNSWETPNQNNQPNGQTGWGENTNPNNNNQNGGW